MLQEEWILKRWREVWGKVKSKEKLRGGDKFMPRSWKCECKEWLQWPKLTVTEIEVGQSLFRAVVRARILKADVHYLDQFVDVEMMINFTNIFARHFTLKNEKASIIRISRHSCLEPDCTQLHIYYKLVNPQIIFVASYFILRYLTLSWEY